MTALTLTLRTAPARSIDLTALTPERLTGLGGTQVGALELRDGLYVEDLFEIGDGDSQHLIFRNSCERLTHIGAGMRSGMITVEGDCGSHAGLGMKGGSLIINGNAGDFAGGALPGDRQGMRGGILAIQGNAGDRAGERMRRGLLLVGGSAGAYCAANMLAGTIFVAGRVGSMPGFSLKRGTLLLKHTPEDLPATFQDSGEHVLLFLTLLENQLRQGGDAFARFLPFAKKVRRYCGDLAWGGTGEILVFV
jgi:formylmethanofuran dehydrogenase subunit C